LAQGMKVIYVLPAVAATSVVALLYVFYRRRRKSDEEVEEDDGVVEVDVEDSAVVRRLDPSHGLVRKTRPIATQRRTEGVGTQKVTGAPQDVELSSGSTTGSACGSEHSDREAARNVPGVAKIFVKTYGCSHNTSDSEFMMGQLKEYGYTFTSDLDEADCVLLNSCTVKNPSQETVLNLAKKARSRCPVVIAGCVTQADAEVVKSLDDNVSVLGLHHVDRVVEAVESALAGNKVLLIEPIQPLKNAPSLPSLTLPKVRRNPLVEIISINTGCLGNCTYCKTKQARGTLQSYPIDVIVERVRSSIKEGVQQIWLTSEDTGAYGLDINTNIVHLLRAVVNEVPDGCMLRLGMTNPPYMMKHIQAVGEILNHPRVFEFIHIPVQSGSDKVLMDMQREYTIGMFRRLCKGLREKCPHLTIATDIITSFPTEREEDHRKTVELVDEFKFPIVNITQFYPRPNTAAANMKRIHGNISKQRRTEVTNAFHSYETNEKYEGCIERVWFSDTEAGRRQTVGHTKTHVKVLVDQDDSLLGQNRMVQITGTSKWHISGHVVEG